MMKKAKSVAGVELALSGRLITTARLRSEYYETLSHPPQFIEQVREAGTHADLLTFLQSATDSTPRYHYHAETDEIAVLPITTYEHWWTQQIRDKVRNMVRRAPKKGVEIRVVPFTDELVHGIREIYNETPVRQGRKFPHYGKDIATLKDAHATFLERSEFVTAYLKDELIGFIKLVHGNNISNLMQIISALRHRDKAPIDALLAKAVEICAAKGVPNLHYGSWSLRGLGEFKIHRGFRRVEVPRYYVPLTLKGNVALQCRLHRKLSDHFPEKFVDFVATFRNRWHALGAKAESAVR